MGVILVKSAELVVPIPVTAQDTVRVPMLSVRVQLALTVLRLVSSAGSGDKVNAVTWGAGGVKEPTLNLNLALLPPVLIAPA